MENDLGILERFLTFNRSYLHKIRYSRRINWIFALHPEMRQLYADALQQAEIGPEEENLAISAVVNAYEETAFWKASKLFDCLREDIGLYIRQRGRRKIIDRSDRKKKDYYSVAVIVKNEARYLKEFILFYQATGAERIYLYDNGSTDNRMEVLEPFINSGFVVYRYWPGHTAQTAAYRDAVRRTRKRTTWLALIDADEFLFSPKGKMPEQLRKFEAYPGVGANWVIFGPNGHVKKPEGLVMDAYTTTPADYNNGINCHIKSVVQPSKVLTVFHPHYAIYRKGYAVGEDGAVLDNRTTRTFSREHHHDMFRINHYTTKSLEDLEEKCRRGYPDGSPNAVFENQLKPFEAPLREDHAIKPYEDMVRQKWEEDGVSCREKASLKRSGSKCAD